MDEPLPLQTGVAGCGKVSTCSGAVCPFFAVSDRCGCYDGGRHCQCPLVLLPHPRHRRPRFGRPCPRRGWCCSCNRCQARRSIKDRETKNCRITGVGGECGSTICTISETCHGELLLSGPCVVLMSSCVAFPVMI